MKKATRTPPTSTLRPPSIPQPSLPPAWTRGPRNQHPPLGTGSGPSPGTLLSPSPKPAKLSGWAHEMTLHVSRWQRRACDGERTAPAAGGHQPRRGLGPCQLHPAAGPSAEGEGGVWGQVIPRSAPSEQTPQRDHRNGEKESLFLSKNTEFLYTLVGAGVVPYSQGLSGTCLCVHGQAQQRPPTGSLAPATTGSRPTCRHTAPAAPSSSRPRPAHCKGGLRKLHLYWLCKRLWSVHTFHTS